ncbi:tetratricopeptide repeat protein [Candidatus Sumerlaeota bacterium]|nr:tetratricopeptide repeat protein [Candidatus Sumerlaeota bacterium]
MAISLPAGIAILLWARDGKLQPRAILPLIPMFALAVAIGLLDARYSFGLSDYQSGLGAADRIALAGRAVWFYAGKCLWPSSLMTNYPRWDQIGSRAGDWIYPAACGFFPAMCWIARKRTALYPLLAALFFIITLSPTLGLIDYGFMLYSYVADRFQYLAAIGPMVLTCGFLSKCLDELRRVNLRRRPQPAAQFVLLGAGPILLSGLGVLTFHQAALYKDITALFSDNLNKHPKSWPSWYNVGYEFDKKGELETARQYYLKAVEFNPRSIDALDNLALALHKTGRPAEAIPYFNAALAIDPRDTTALNNLGIIALQQGNGPAAEDYFNRSLAAKPNHPSSLNNLGMLQQALAVKPDYPDALNNLANACLTQNKPAEAEKALRRAVAIEPRHLKCLYNLGMILLQSGRAAEAVEFLRRAAEVNPNYLEALNALGVGYAQLGQLGQAVEVFSRVLQINPNDPDAVKNLQMAQQRLNAASGDRSR